jgi:itaconyl-CoA hydratase
MPEFLAYIQTGEKRYRERCGLDFEQFAVGQKFKHRPGLTLSQQDSRDECLDTLNQQMLHFDEQFATHTEWKRCLMDSTLTTKVVWGMTWKTFAKRVRLLGFDEITLTKPVFGGDTIYAESEILEKADWPAEASYQVVGSVAPLVPKPPEAGAPPQSDNRVGRLKVCTQGLNQRGDTVAKLVYDLLVGRAGQDDFTRVNY